MSIMAVNSNKGSESKIAFPGFLREGGASDPAPIPVAGLAPESLLGFAVAAPALCVSDRGVP